MGFKIGSTAIIWSFSTGMLAICIPLVSMTESGVILPLTVVLGATISTVVVWLSSLPTMEDDHKNDTDS